VRGLFVLVAIAAPAVAAASPRTDAITRHSDADVAALRAELPGDATVRCTLGAVYAERGDLPRASLYLDPCGDLALDDAALPEIVARARREVTRKLRDSDLSAIDVLTDPEGATAEVDTMPGDRFTTPQMVWAPAGHHTVTATSAAGVTATNTIDTKPHAQGPLLIALAAPAPVQVHDGAVDMSEDNAGEQHEGPPPDIKHPALRPSRFIDGGTEAGPVIADPLAEHDRPTHSTGLRVGLRFGGGVFDHSGADARAGFDAAAVIAVPFAPRLAFAARLDWSRRGGDQGDMHGVDALGATAGVGVTLAHLAALDVVAGGGARVALALEDPMDASRTSLAGAAWLELPLHAAPIVVGVRVEHGITSFAPGARDEAAIVEVGVDF
jgi:hypothetical protein